MNDLLYKCCPNYYLYNYFSAPVVSEQPSQYLAMDLGYGGVAGSTLLVLRSTLEYVSRKQDSHYYFLSGAAHGHARHVLFV